MSRIRRGFRAASLALGVGAVTASAYFIHRNDYDISSVGATRLSRAAVATCRIVFDYKWALRGVDDTSDAYMVVQSAVHRRSAERLLRLACANGGVWIKVGQHCGALEYLLPKEYTSTLSVLHSDAPQSSYQDVCRVICEDLHLQDPAELFSEMDERPIGAASLAQVHRAVLKKSGQVVALKVQHPRVLAHSLVDIVVMESLIKVVAKLFPEFKLMWLVGEMKKNLPLELDFLSEGDNADRVRRMFAHLPFLKVPKIHWDLSTKRILTMEFCDGFKVNDVEAYDREQISKREVCRNLAQLYSEMIFAHGYVHCDPHPGNVLIHKQLSGAPQIVLLDHGLYTTLHDDVRVKYCRLWLSLLSADLNGIRHWAGELGVGDMYGLFACMLTARSWRSVTSGIDRSAASAQEHQEIQTYATTLLPHITSILDRVPRQILLVMKVNDLLRSVEHRLQASRSNGSYSFLQMTRCCVTTVRDAELREVSDSFVGRMTVYWRCWLRLLRIQIYEHLLFIGEIYSNSVAILSPHQQI